MAVTAVEGVVENGHIQLQDGVALPEHAKVYVIVVPNSFAPVIRLPGFHLANPEQAKLLKKTVIEVAPNAQL